VFYPTIKSVEDTNEKDNNKSCLLKETSHFGSILFTGDIEKEAYNTFLNHNIKAMP
jgi:competence protein ComEC